MRLKGKYKNLKIKFSWQKFMKKLYRDLISNINNYQTKKIF